MSAEVVPPAALRGHWVRLLFAWAVTFGVLPYLWGRTLVWTLLVGRPDPRVAAVTAVVVAGLMVLTWKARPPARGVGVFLGWLVANAILIGLFAVPRMPLWQLLPVFVAATVWVVWLAWLGAWPLAWPARLGLLGVWLGLGWLGPALVRVEGMMGDTGIVFAWRDATPAGPAAESRTAAAPIDLTPTADDFPHYLGPDRTGVLPNAKIAGDWKTAPPREVWRRAVGEGWGSFAVVGDYAFTQEQRGPKECVSCYRLSDGATVWTHADESRFEGLGGVGPCATPAVAGGKVYAAGAKGILNCLDGATGKLVWSVNILADNGATRVAGHGVCASPLVDGDRVLVCPTGAGGPSLAAYHKDTGTKLWATGTDQASYASPLIAEVAGRRHILLNTSAGVAGHDAADGRLLWRCEWTNGEGINAAQPIPNAGRRGRVFVSTGYGKGAALFPLRIGKGPSNWETDDPVWTSPRMKTKFTTPVLYQGHVYGLDDGILACLDVETGRQRWKDGRYGHGQVLLAGDRLIVQAESGAVVLVEPSPDKLIERGRVAALSSKTWNHPALAGQYLLVRNDREAVCYELSAP